MKLTREQVMTLAGAAGCDPRTVENIYSGKASKVLVRERVCAAAKRLKMAAPPNNTK